MRLLRIGGFSSCCRGEPLFLFAQLAERMVGGKRVRSLKVVPGHAFVDSKACHSSASIRKGLGPSLHIW